MNFELVKKLFCKYLFNFSEIDLNENIDSIIEQVEDIIINKKQYIVNSDKFHIDLLLLKRKLELEKILLDQNFHKCEKKLFSDFYFTRQSDYLISDTKITIDSISYLNGKNTISVKLLNLLSRDRIESLGYKITQIKIPIFTKIKTIFCEGKHTNLNPRSKEFCLSHFYFNCDFNYENISNIIQCMSCMCLYDNYLTSQELQDVFSIINLGEK